MDIKIAPDLEEITVTDTCIYTRWNGGICYKARLKPIRQFQGDEWLKECFRAAIALGSKSWQVEQLLNRHFKKRGHLSNEIPEE